jgi:ribonuclease HIII
MRHSITYRFGPDDLAIVRDLLASRGFRFDDAPHAYFTAKVPGCSATFYKSGKLLLQGKQAEFFAELLSPGNVRRIAGVEPFAEALAKHPEHETGFSRWVGSDESGKGDYFGPLVVCAARVERDQLELLAELGAADCKSLSDKQVTEMAPALKATVAYRQIAVGPKRYNELYGKMGRNLNRLLAWCHARAIEDLLEAHPDAELIVVDRFGPPSRVEKALMDRGSQLPLVQRPRAEDDPAVAVASVIARNEFIWQLRKLGKRFGQRLPKGAGPPVDGAGRQLVAKQGAEVLSQVAKLHFKNTEKITKPRSSRSRSS